MMCPMCQSKQSKIVSSDQRANGQYRRERCFVHCGTVYTSVEIDATVFTRLIDLLRARRDLDQQLLEVCQWGLHHDRQARETKKEGICQSSRGAAVDSTASSTC